jgi:hypothetical protein
MSYAVLAVDIVFGKERGYPVTGFIVSKFRKKMNLMPQPAQRNASV